MKTKMRNNHKQKCKAHKARKQEFKRLSNKEFSLLEKSVHQDNELFEKCIHGVLRRRDWVDFLESSVKKHEKKLSKEIKDKLKSIIKSAREICEEDAIELTLEHFSGDIRSRRTTLSIERALRNKENGIQLSQEEKLLAEIFGK